MKFKTLTGKTKEISIKKYLIDWDGDSLSKFQMEVKDFLYPFWKNDVVCEELIMAGTKMRFDMVNISRKIVVEVQGAQHNELNNYWNQGSKLVFLKQLKKDMSKFKWCELNGFKFVEIEPNDELTPKLFLERYNISL
jgi:hypothetical protein